MKHIRSIVLALGLAVGFGFSAHAVLVKQDQFAGYNTGNLGADAGTGANNNWENAQAQVTLTNGSGSLNGLSLGLVSSFGDRVFVSGVSNFNAFGPRNKFVGTNNAAFPNASDTNIYYSFLYKFNDTSIIPPEG